MSIIFFKAVAQLKCWKVLFFKTLVIHSVISWQAVLMLSNTGLDHILELYLWSPIMSLLNSRKCWKQLEFPTIPVPKFERYLVQS